ncbi:AAA family ATPase [Umezawaea endophytica]|nr:LuxR family transcriptional regulator [Umezawaea endophytica]
MRWNGPWGSLVERDAELEALRRAFADLAGGGGGVVVLDGAAGLGKTALLRHARELAGAAGVTVLHARGAELERDFTFGVVRQLLEPALPRDRDERAELFTGAARATIRLFGHDEPGDEVAGASYALLNGLYWLLVTMSERGALVVVVDDAQWADLPSMRFIGFLARRLESLPVLVVVATRAAEHEDGGLLDDVLTTDVCLLLPLRNLSAAAVTDLVRRELGEAASDAFCAACHATTAGNPLFVRELLRVLVANEVSPDAAGAGSVEAAGPDAIRRHVAARLRRQPGEVQRVARAVAVLGDDTALVVVAEQSGVTPEVVVMSAERLTRHGIFERADPPAFVHAVVRDVALSLVPLVDRGAEHDRAASVLRRAGEPVARVASHLLRTIPAANPDRIPVLLAAAEEAWLRGSPQGASVYLARARAEPPAAQHRSEVSRRLGNCEAHHLAVEDAAAHLEEALALADDPEQRARCAYSLARFRNACGDTGPALELLSRAVDELPEGADPVLAGQMAEELMGFARAWLSARPLQVDLLARLGDRLGRSSPVLTAQRAVESAIAGAPVDETLVLARKALVGNSLTPERSAIWAAVTTLVVADRLGEAEHRVQRALAFAVDRGLLLPMGVVRGYLARISLLRGDLAQAAEHVEIGTRAVPEPNVGLPALDSTRIHLLVEQGDLTGAADVLRRSVLGEGQDARSTLEVWLLEARARLRAEQGDDAAALADALACGAAYEQWGAPGVWEVPWRLHAAGACLRLERRDQAAELIAEELRAARSLGVPRHIAVALRHAARLGDTSAALSEAVDLLRDGPARLELARALADLGAHQVRIGSGGPGRQNLRQAAELAVECRATGLAERLRASLTANGGRSPRVQVSGVPSLTPAERQVADLAADALTNRQIAEKLFVSEKTVETHLSRAYRKVGVTSRTQLAVRMAAARERQGVRRGFP